MESHDLRTPRSDEEDRQQKEEREWISFHKALADVPHSLHLINQQQVSSKQLEKLATGLQSALSVGYKTPLETARAKNFLAYLLFRQGHVSEALGQMQEALAEEGEGQNLVSLANMADILWKTGRRQEAEERVQRIQTMKKDVADYDYLVVKAKAELAFSYTRIGPTCFPMADSIFSEVLANAKEPEKWLWTFGLGLTKRRALHQQKHFTHQRDNFSDELFETLSVLQDVITNSRSRNLRAKAYAEMALLLNETRDEYTRRELIKKARMQPVQACERALELDKDDCSVLCKTGRIFRVYGRLDSAIKLLEKALAIRPSSTGYHHLGLAFNALATRKTIGKRGGERREGIARGWRNRPWTDDRQTEGMENFRDRPWRGPREKEEPSRAGLGRNYNRGETERERERRTGIEGNWRERPQTAFKRGREETRHWENWRERGRWNSEGQGQARVWRNQSSASEGRWQGRWRGGNRGYREIPRSRGRGDGGPLSRGQEFAREAGREDMGDDRGPNSYGGLLLQRSHYEREPEGEDGEQAGYVETFREMTLDNPGRGPDQSKLLIHNRSSSEETRAEESPLSQGMPSQKVATVKTKSGRSGANPCAIRAMECFEKALEVSKGELVRAKYDLAVIHKSLHEYEEALHLLEEIHWSCQANAEVFNVIESFELAGLIYREQSQSEEDTQKKKELERRAEFMFNVALIKASKLFCGERQESDEKLWGSFSDLLQSIDYSLCSKNRMSRQQTKFFELIYNTAVLQQIMQMKEVEEDPHQLMRLIKSFVEHKEFDRALVFLELLKYTQQNDATLCRLDDKYYFQKVYAQAAKQALRQNPSAARTLFQCTFVQTFSIPDGQTSTPDEDEGDFDEEEEAESDKDDVDMWDVAVVHDREIDRQSQAESLAGVLSNICGLKVTRMDEDAGLGTVADDVILRVVAKSRLVVVLTGSEGISSEIMLVLRASQRPDNSAVALIADGDHMPTELENTICRSMRCPQELLRLSADSTENFANNFRRSDLEEPSIAAICIVFSFLVGIPAADSP